MSVLRLENDTDEIPANGHLVGWLKLFEETEITQKKVTYGSISTE